MARTWKAIDRHGYSICTVTISPQERETVEDFLERASAEVARQLDRPGRAGYLRRWREDGGRLAVFNDAMGGGPDEMP